MLRLVAMKKCERCGKSFNCVSDEGCGCFSAAKVPSLSDLPVAKNLHEGEDFYYDHGLFVFTASYHLKKGYCCDNGCRHCPYKSSK